MKKIFSSRIITIAVILALVFQPCNVQAGAFDQIRAIARKRFFGRAGRGGKTAPDGSGAE